MKLLCRGVELYNLLRLGLEPVIDVVQSGRGRVDHGVC